jgi:hypothetical protein
MGRNPKYFGAVSLANVAFKGAKQLPKLSD